MSKILICGSGIPQSQENQPGFTELMAEYTQSQLLETPAKLGICALRMLDEIPSWVIEANPAEVLPLVEYASEVIVFVSGKDKSILATRRDRRALDVVMRTMESQVSCQVIKPEVASLEMANLREKVRLKSL
jgi:hypothetical protein